VAFSQLSLHRTHALAAQGGVLGIATTLEEAKKLGVPEKAPEGKAAPSPDELEKIDFGRHRLVAIGFSSNQGGTAKVSEVVERVLIVVRIEVHPNPDRNQVPSSGTLWLLLPADKRLIRSEILKPTPEP